MIVQSGFSSSLAETRRKDATPMPIQKRTVSGVGKPAEPKQSKAEANPLKATPFAAHTMAKKKKKTSGFTATTLKLHCF
jgi:hypothetical protein